MTSAMKWTPPPTASAGDILRAAARVLDVAEKERLERLAASGAAADEWAEVERIRDLPEVDEALLNFKDDCTGDNAAMVVRAVMRAARGVQPSDGGLRDGR